MIYWRNDIEWRLAWFGGCLLPSHKHKLKHKHKGTPLLVTQAQRHPSSGDTGTDAPPYIIIVLWLQAFKCLQGRCFWRIATLCFNWPPEARIGCRSFTRTHTHIYTRAHTHTNTHTYTHVHTHIHACTHWHIQERMCMHTRLQRPLHSSHVQIYTHNDTLTQTCKNPSHTHTHPRTHTTHTHSVQWQNAPPSAGVSPRGVVSKACRGGGPCGAYGGGVRGQQPSWLS
jgi:hypothetical protein